MTSDDSTPDLDQICTVLDKLTLDALTLMEEHIQTKINIENCMVGGELSLAKCRYILGQNNVSALQIPTENQDIEATVVVKEEEDDTLFENKSMHLEVVKHENQVDPIKWFGYLVPQDLNKAQNLFKQALNWIVQAANLQVRLDETCDKIEQLKKLKKTLKS